MTLTAYNALGSNTKTRSNYITVCNEAILYPTTISMDYPAGGNQHYTGTLANLQSADGNCVVLYSDTTGAGIADAAFMRFIASTSYTQNQILGAMVELREMVNDQGDNDTVSRPSWDKPDCTIYPLPAQLTNYSFTIPPSEVFDDSGNVMMGLCNFPHTTYIPITVSVDLVRFHLYLTPSGGSPPTANFTGNPTTGTPPLAVAFTDTSTGGPTAWSWTFGDGGTSTVQNPSHTYTAVNQYTVALKVTNQYGNNTNTKTNYINVGNAPVANFTGTPTSGTAPLAVTFTDSSTNSPTAWSWTFGDGGTSTAQNPSHTYTVANTYTVALKATNQYGNNTNTKSNYITVTGSAPVANFTGTPTSGTAPLAVTFTDSSTNSPTVWSWTFGDGGTSTAQNPSHTYTVANTYTVALKATNQYGNNTNTKSNYITVTSSGGTPVYQINGAGPAVSPFVADEDYSGGSNGNTGANVDTSHVTNPAPMAVYQTYRVDTCTYTLPGLTPSTNYTVRLHFNEGFETGPNQRQFNVSIQGTQVLTNFDIYAVAGGKDIANIQQFTATADSNGHIVIAFTRGVYDAPVISGIEIITTSGGSAPTANFTGTPTIGTPPLAVSFTDTSTGSPTSWSWNFGDSNTSTVQNPSHTYSTVGQYTVALTATNQYGNNTMTKTNYINVGNAPVANFSGTPTSGGAPLAVSFTDSSTNSPTAWSWNFGDSNTSTVQNPSHTYSTTGSYTVALKATNQYGNNTNTKTNYITVGSAPVAAFSGTPTSGAAPLAVAFTDSSTNSPTVWSWNFGDSNTSTVQNPSHTYTATGQYTVALKATNQYGNNTNTKTNYITVSSGGTPVYQIDCGSTSAVSPFAADNYYSGGSTSSTSATIDTSKVTNPAPWRCTRLIGWTPPPIPSRA